MLLLIIVILGLCLGSFLNAFVYRLNENTKIKSRKNKLSITKGRSICPSCKHVLGPMDLFPVLSWVFLRGKCRYCKNKISPQYPVVEILTAIFFLISFIDWPYGFSVFGWVEFILWLLILTHFIILSVYDFKWLILPNKIVFFLSIVGIIEVAMISFSNHKDYLSFIGSLLAGGLLFGFFYILFQLSSGKWIGGGDVKIAFVLGVIAITPINAMVLIFIASVLGTFFSLPSITLKKRKLNSHIPFGPFLILATFIVFIYSSNIQSIYHSLYF
jgi:leader peptidase (prepilin peptidase) / N-methyltransferase